MAEIKKNHPISWVESNTSYVVEEVKKREQSRCASKKQLTPIVRRRNGSISKQEIAYAVMEK